MKRVIVSRHLGAIQWLQEEYPKLVHGAVIVDSATLGLIRGAHVVGNLPMHLACLAASVTAIHFEGDAPRGREYTAQDMRAAGARLCRYHVTNLSSWEQCGADVTDADCVALEASRLAREEGRAIEERVCDLTLSSTPRADLARMDQEVEDEEVFRDKLGAALADIARARKKG